MDTIDWRDELQPHSRRRAVKRIMDAVKEHHDFDDEDELQELEKFCQSFERKTFAGATSKSDYGRKINSKKAAMDRKLREEINQKIIMFKEVYLPELIKIFQIIANRHQQIQMLKEVNFPELSEMFRRSASGFQQLDSLLQQEVSDNSKELELFKGIFETISSYIALSKWEQSPSFKDELVTYEKEIINLINANRPCKMYYLQPGQVSPHAMHSLPQPQSQLTQLYFHENQINSQWEFQEMYQKIQMLKEMYLPELNEMHQIIVNKLRRIDTHPQTTQSDKCRWLSLDSLLKVLLPMKTYKYERPKILKIKAILERIIALLQSSVSDISPALKEELPSYEKQIITFININRSKDKGCQACFGYKLFVPSMTGNFEEFIVSESDFS